MTIGMRTSDEDQLRGLDLSEHGAEGYPEFMGGSRVTGTITGGVPIEVSGD